MATSITHAAETLVLNGQRLTLVRDDTDFSVTTPSEEFSQQFGSFVNNPDVHITTMASGITRVSAPAEQRERLMGEVRTAGQVAHHVYKITDTEEEIAITNKLFVTLKNPDALADVIADHHLEVLGQFGETYVMGVTSESGGNPVKVANALTRRSDVVEAMPDILLDLQLSSVPALYPKQWHLEAAKLSQTVSNIAMDAGINVEEAWEITKGAADIVLAVADDGFDLKHPALKNASIHPAAFDFISNSPIGIPDKDAYHGMPVATLIVGDDKNSAISGVAPDCTLLPLCIAFGPKASQLNIMDVFRHASEHADFMNNSWGIGPSTFKPFVKALEDALTEMTLTGGKDGKGLGIFFALGNDDGARLTAAQNVNGLMFTAPGRLGGTVIKQLPAGRDTFLGYPGIDGIYGVAASNSRNEKSGYSSCGPDVDFCAPSNDTHYIVAFIKKGQDPLRELFEAPYSTHGQVTAINRPGFGRGFGPMEDNTLTELREDFYTSRFGGTSGATPVAVGVAGLVKSAYKELWNQEVGEIMRVTASKNMKPTSALVLDPNMQGITGEFGPDGVSFYYGHGKVDAGMATTLAVALKKFDAENPEQPENPRVVGGRLTPLRVQEIAALGKEVVQQVTQRRTTALVDALATSSNLPRETVSSIVEQAQDPFVAMMATTKVRQQGEIQPLTPDIITATVAEETTRLATLDAQREQRLKEQCITRYAKVANDALPQTDVALIYDIVKAQTDLRLVKRLAVSLGNGERIAQTPEALAKRRETIVAKAQMIRTAIAREDKLAQQKVGRSGMFFNERR